MISTSVFSEDFKMKFEKAAENACNALNIKKGDKITIIADRVKEFFAKELATKIINERSANLSYFIMEDYGKRPYKPSKLMLQALENSDSAFFIMEYLKGELSLFRQPIYDLTTKSKKLKLATMPHITAEILNDGMLADFDAVDRFSKKVYDLLIKTRELKVKTDIGTDLTAIVGKYKWVKSAAIEEGSWGNLPGGEVFTTPEHIEGIAVVDGVIGSYIEQKCKDYPVHLEIKNSRIIYVSCKNKNLEKKVRGSIEKDKYSSRIGEFALGTNYFIKNIVGNTVQDEKYPGVHFASGDPLGNHTGAKWSSIEHTDYVLPRTTVYADDKLIMNKGVYLIK